MAGDVRMRSVAGLHRSPRLVHRALRTQVFGLGILTLLALTLHVLVAALGASTP
ncbi:MAG: hypothetical protein R3B72_38170 [Polyangiaceae bacterium]